MKYKRTSIDNSKHGVLRNIFNNIIDGVLFNKGESSEIYKRIA
jgi:hypothetical protein